MQRRVSTMKSTQTQSGDDLRGFSRKSAFNLESQINQGPRSQGIKNKLPKSDRYGDISHRATDTGFSVIMQDGKGGNKQVDLHDDISGFIGLTSQSGAPAVADFPDDGNWGFYLNTSTSKLYLSRNISGTLYQIDVSTLSGSITTAQHGDLSGGGATTMHAFTQITGTITDEKHGALGRKIGAGTAHHTSATTSEAGFMSATDKTNWDAAKIKLDAANSSGTASTLVMYTAAGDVVVGNSGSFNVGSNQVVGARNTGWTAMTGSPDESSSYATGTVTLPELAGRVAALQAALTNHGLIGT